MNENKLDCIVPFQFEKKFKKKLTNIVDLVEIKNMLLLLAKILN